MSAQVLKCRVYMSIKESYTCIKYKELYTGCHILTRNPNAFEFGSDAEYHYRNQSLNSPHCEMMKQNRKRNIIRE